MGSKTEDVLLRIGADVSGLRKELGTGRKGLQDFEGQVGSTIGKLGQLAGVLGLGLGFAKLIGEALEFADTMTRVSEQTGMSTDAVQRLNFIASQTGTTLDQITGGIGKMQKNLVAAADGGKAASEALELMGIDAVQFLKLNPDEQFTKVAEAISSIRNPADKTASAMAVFGKAGADLIPTLDAVGKRSAELSEQFQKIGGPVSAEAIAAVDKLGDSAAAAGLAAKGLATELLAVVAPAVIAGLEGITTLLASIKHLAAGGGNELVNVGVEMQNLGVAIKNLEMASDFEKQTQMWKDRRAQLQEEMVMLKAKEQALIDAPMKEAQAKMAAAKMLPDPAQELADIVVHEKAKTVAILDAETERHLLMLEARGTMLAELEAQLRDSDIRINEESLKGLSEREQFVNSSYKAQANTIFGELAGITQGVAQHNKALFNINKAAGVANAIISCYEGVAKSLATYPMPLAGVMAAVHLAAGLANVMAIKNQSYNGGGAGSAPSNTTATPTPVTPAGGGQGGGAPGSGTLRVEGLDASSLFTGKMVRGLAEKLAEHQKDGGTVLFS